MARDLAGLVVVAAAALAWDAFAKVAGHVTVTGAVRRAAGRHPVAFGAGLGALVGHLVGRPVPSRHGTPS